jgi:LacI family transcriptional regulator, gluconate utilization system Gnt-I transcriptional repressor
MMRLLERWPDTQAVVSMSDLAAFCALTECHCQGIDVSGRLAIAGFGAHELADVCV